MAHLEGKTIYFITLSWLLSGCGYVSIVLAVWEWEKTLAKLCDASMEHVMELKVWSCFVSFVISFFSGILFEYIWESEKIHRFWEKPHATIIIVQWLSSLQKRTAMDMQGHLEKGTSLSLIIMQRREVWPTQVSFTTQHRAKNSKRSTNNIIDDSKVFVWASNTGSTSDMKENKTFQLQSWGPQQRQTLTKHTTMTSAYQHS